MTVRITPALTHIRHAHNATELAYARAQKRDRERYQATLDLINAAIRSLQAAAHSLHDEKMQGT